ncbi:MAG TPA: hypothetical protein VHR44_06465 [Beijerinckiaceae bacterium]|jgi:hypothetical protein|nr:hypothetical protein [Beijerinckiaceae bacterium]
MARRVTFPHQILVIPDFSNVANDFIQKTLVSLRERSKAFELSGEQVFQKAFPVRLDLGRSRRAM